MTGLMTPDAPGGLLFRTAYWDDPPAQAAFRELAREIFDLDFTAWADAGCWDHDYRPFSYFDSRGRVVASVCLYSMQLIVEGRPVLAGQFSAVATRPE